MSTASDKKYDTWASIITAAENHVKEVMRGQDGSHDWHHVNRVRNLAAKFYLAALTAKESEYERKIADHSIRAYVIELAALLHDIKDWKYTPAVSAAPIYGVEGFLESLKS